MSKWKRMKSAPRDGTDILVTNGKYITSIRYRKDNEKGIHAAEMIKDFPWELSDSNEYRVTVCRETTFTHWQPMLKMPC